MGLWLAFFGKWGTDGNGPWDVRLFSQGGRHGRQWLSGPPMAVFSAMDSRGLAMSSSPDVSLSPVISPAASVDPVQASAQAMAMTV